MLVILAALVFSAIVIAIGLTYSRWEGQSPEVVFERDFIALSRTPTVGLTITDTGNGLRRVTIRLQQSGQDVILADESLDRTTASRAWDIGKLITENQRVQNGPATLTVSASDHSYRNFFGGNRTEVTKAFEFDLDPPRLEVLSGQHYINQGGAECVVYRVSDDVEVSGVQVGPHFFPGFPANPSDRTLRFALFAFAYDQPADTRVQVVARDAAGNESIAQPWHRVFPRRFRSREIPLDDAFLQKVVPEILSHTPGVAEQSDLVATYVEINSNLRRQNHDRLKVLSMESADSFLWKDAFLQLSNSQVESLFADRRTYTYQGKAVDQQDHVGFDLSVTQQYPIEAANDGKVLLAEYFGIYGNTVLLDHGTGLVSLYGHLSSIEVKPGQMVKKKDRLGRSGATGLAGGDHLHFGLFLHGVPVNPTEWWDPKWVTEHVLDRLKSAGGATGL
jgi:murein DD-endopeptidase MepM/ murein hydrolase activator NlpD